MPGLARHFYAWTCGSINIIMMWSELLTALALVFVLEGIIPFVNPDGLRKMFMLALQLDNNMLRFIGLTSMLVGLILLYIVH